MSHDTNIRQARPKVLSSEPVTYEPKSDNTNPEQLTRHPHVAVNGEGAQDEVDLSKRKERLLAVFDQATEAQRGELSSEHVVMGEENGMNNPQQPATANEDLEGETDQKRLPRDLDTVKRMIYGSLGVRAPKTKEEEERTRLKLMSMNGAAKHISSDVHSAEVVDIKFEEVSDAWKAKIILSAVECCEDGIVLSTPPFPFVQRWDPQQQATQTQGKQQGKKRKRKGREDYGYGGVGEEVFDGSYEGENSTTVLDYDYETDPNASSILQGQVESQIMNDIAAANDLPPLPTTLQNLKGAALADIAPGAIIAYKVLEVSEATGWAPAISSYKTAMVLTDDELSGSTFKVELALRDRTQAKYDDEGNRVFEKFDMIVENDEEDDGIRILNFEELYEPKIVRAGQVDDAMVVGKDD